MKADVSDAAGNPATEATQTLTVDEHAPTIAIDSNLAGGDNTVNISEAAAGFAITGTTTGAESGQTVTVHIVDGSNAVVDSYTTTAGSGTWSVNVTAAQAQALADGSYTVKADVSDVAGNPATEATQTLTVDEHAPTMAIDSNLAGGDNTVNISEAAAGFAITGTTTGAESGQTVTVHIVDGSNAVVDSYTTTAGSGTWSVNVTAAQAQALADGSYTVKADVSDAAGNPATEATQTLTVDEHAPTIAIDSNLAGGDNTVNISEAAAGFAITGTTTGAESGQTVTVHIVDGSNAVVDSYTTTAGSGTWSVNVTAAQAQALADGSYTVKADVSDAAGNPATEATQTLTVDEHAPTIAIDSNLAGGDNTVNISEAAAGFAITGTTTGAESGQTVTVHIVDGSNAVVDSYTTTAGSGTWSVNVTAAQAQALADGSYTVKADVSDPPATRRPRPPRPSRSTSTRRPLRSTAILRAATTPSTSARPRPALPSPAPPRVRRAARPSRSILSTARTPLLIATPPRPAAAPGRSTSRRHRRRRWPTAAIR